MINRTCSGSLSHAMSVFSAYELDSALDLGMVRKCILKDSDRTTFELF